MGIAAASAGKTAGGVSVSSGSGEQAGGGCLLLLGVPVLLPAGVWTGLAASVAAKGGVCLSPEAA